VYELCHFILTGNNDVIHVLFKLKKARPQPFKVIRDDDVGQWLTAASCKVRQRLLRWPRFPFVFQCITCHLHFPQRTCGIKGRFTHVVSCSAVQCHPYVVCLSSVTLLRSTRGVELTFRQYFPPSSSLGTWTICIKTLGKCQRVLGDRVKWKRL